MSDVTKLITKKLNKKVIILAVALIAIVLIVVLAIVASRSASAKKLEEQLSLGEKYLSELEYEQAVAAYLAVIEIDPKNVDAYLGLADAYVAMGKYNKAIEVLEDALNEFSGDEAETVRKKLNEVRAAKIAAEVTPSPTPTPTSEPTTTSTSTPTNTPMPERETADGTFKWEVKDDGTIVIVEVVDKSLSRLEIPAEIEEKPVTEIGKFAFNDCGNMEEVLLPNGITSIGIYAFSGCDNLQNIILPEGITEISENTFQGCGKLTKVVIPNGVIKIGNYAFGFCSALENIVLPNSIQQVGKHAFYQCLNLREIELSNQLEIVGDYAFSECLALEKLYLPESLKSLGRGAFYSCTNLSEIYIPQSIEILGEHVFSGTKWLGMNTTAEEMVIVNGVLLRGINQENVVIPEGVTRIAQGAFQNCQVKTVSFPDSLVSIEGHAFLGTYWDNPGKMNIAGKVVYSVGANVSGDVQIPEGMISISDYAFAWNDRIINVYIPATVKEIGEAAFLDCPNLTIITPSGSYAEQYATENGIPYRNE